MITSITLQYKNVFSTGQIQWIGFSDAEFERTPEPSTALLLSIGLIALAIRRRNR